MPTRREFFKQAAALSGSAGLASALLSSIQRASAIEAPAGSTYLDAEHVVILMQENRSFDHCFGTLRGVRGFNDPRAVTQPDGKPVWLQTDAAGKTCAPFRLGLKETRATWLGSLPHSWADQTDARNHGHHDKWLDSKPSGREECTGMPLTMGYYNREDLPFYYAFADAFTICDQYFCSSLTGTTANRLYLWTGTIRETQDASSTPRVRNSEVDDHSRVHWRTFPERLEEAGVSWKIYQNELNLRSGFEAEEASWLSNFSDNPIEWFTQFNAGFAKNYRRELDRLAVALPGEIEKLRRDKAKEFAARERLLAFVISERALWTDEAFAKLTPQELSLHAKAFATNAGDPHYRELETLRYKDGDQEREIEIPKGDVLHQFRHDVKNGQLPAVSWLVSPERFSDHPSSPWYGAWYVAEALDILTSNPEVWKKTIFILNYDENDGYFDHVPPFVAPDPRDPESGKCSPGIDAALEFMPLEQDLARRPPKDARGGPLGLGYRVPLMVASPWSRGGYVCSQVFDHTSVLQLLETITSRRSGKQIRETNISTWRRTVCGDLSSAFRASQEGKAVSLPFPPKDAFIEGIHKANFKPLPAGFGKISMPRQEAGTRPSTALPYELHADASVVGNRKQVEIVLAAGAAAGAPFHVYAPGTTRKPRAYAVSAGGRLSDMWDFDSGAYHLRLHGPNGFYREFAGSAADPHVSIECKYLPTGDIEVHADRPVFVTDNAYGTGRRPVKQSLVLRLGANHHWYDFTVTIAGADTFLRRYAGRVETGKPGFSDSAMG